MTNRNRKYDYIRIVAMFLVVGVHAWGSISGNNPNPDNSIDTIMQQFLGLGVPLFFALSGANSLGREYTDFLLYYKKRFIVIIIPMLIYAIPYVLYADYETQNLSFRTVEHYFIKILTGQVHNTWWFIYAILGIYFITPFLSSMFLHLSKLQYRLFVFGIYIYLILCTFCSLVDLQFGVTDILFSGHWMNYLFGYFGQETGRCGLSKQKKLILNCGLLLGFVFMYFEQSQTIALNTMLFCLFALLSNNDISEDFGVNRKSFVDYLIIQSYDIYLVHAAILSICLKIYCDWRAFIYVKFIVLVIIVVMISLLISLLIDKLLTKRVQLKIGNSK